MWYTTLKRIKRRYVCVKKILQWNVIGKKIQQFSFCAFFFVPVKSNWHEKKCTKKDAQPPLKNLMVRLLLVYTTIKLIYDFI